MWKLNLVQNEQNREYFRICGELFGAEPTKSGAFMKRRIIERAQNRQFLEHLWKCINQPGAELTVSGMKQDVSGKSRS